MRGSQSWAGGRRVARIAPWWSAALMGLLTATGLAGDGTRSVAAVTSPSGATPEPATDGHSGLVVAAVLAAVVLVALWRVVLYLVVVALVALGLIGLAEVVAPGVAHADSVVPVGAAAGSGSLPVIAVVVLVAAVFAVGLLLGEQWHRRHLARRDRQLAEARRQLTALTRGYRDRRGTD